MNITKENIEVKVQGIYKILQVFLALASSVTSLYLVNTLNASGKYVAMTSHNDIDIGFLTSFVFSHYPKLIIFVILWQILNIVFILFFKNKEWSYSVVLISTIAMFFLEKVVWYANMLPIFGIIDSLS